MKSKCYHRSLFGSIFIGNERIGLCLDCSVIHNVETGNPVSKEFAKIWMNIHPKEAEAYELQ